MSALGRPQALIPERAARRVLMSVLGPMPAPERCPAFLPERTAQVRA